MTLSSLYVTALFNNGHFLPTAFPSDRLEYKRSKLLQVKKGDCQKFALPFSTNFAELVVWILFCSLRNG